MNARQKAKYYKRKYEEAINTPIQPTIIYTNHAIDTLKVARVYPSYLVEGNKNAILQSLKVDMGMAISDGLGKYIEWGVEEEPHTNKYKFTAQIRILKKEEGY